MELQEPEGKGGEAGAAGASVKGTQKQVTKAGNVFISELLPTT